MIHHLSVGTNDLARARAFYDPLLALFGMRVVKEVETALHYGAAAILFSVGRPVDGTRATAGNGSHVCFAAEDRATVDRFHELALANGGSDEGAPGVRPEYDDHYYGAFVRDPDGNKIEAVTYAAK
jgi:catechol 2,3-dioxygenase-like lactoylglutathione lyase family enzyme